MNSQAVSKQAIRMPSKKNMPAAPVKFEGLSGSRSGDQRTVKRKTLSKLSIVPEGSRMMFQKRGVQKVPMYQNTYRLEPFRYFHVETVDKIIQAVLENKLSSVLVYQADYASRLSMETAYDVLKAINKRDYDRCKVVVQVTIVQRMRQSVHTAFQCLWDVGRDNYSYHVFENSYICAWCCVFGLYYE